jgi:hypothetical protein
MDAGTGTKKELYRQALSAGEEGSLRAGRRDSTVVACPRRAQPIILGRRRLEHDGLICIAQNCAHNGAIQSVCCTCFDAPYKAETVANPAQPFDALYFIDTIKPATLI